MAPKLDTAQMQRYWTKTSALMWTIFALWIFFSFVAPLWSFPAMLKVVLLMGVNVLVLPIILAALLYLVNQRSVMGEHTHSGRNLVLAGCVALSVVLAVAMAPTC
jgi:Mn2+/Fe2+ NRAMP family transporter